MPNYKNFAFISYSHRDMAIARWLQKKLERFKLPTAIHNEIDSNSRYLRPVFRDQSDLNTGILSYELRKHLEESKYLILICSKNSAQSQWVSDEAKTFVDMGRLDRIIPVIIPDDEKKERDLFPIFLREYFELFPDKELLGINIRTLGRQQAIVRVVSRMLNVSFDSLWTRHKRQQRFHIMLYSAASVVTLVLTYIFAMPVSFSISVNKEHSNLPTQGAVSLIVNGAKYISTMDDPEFDDVRMPGYKRFGKVSVTAHSQYFKNVDTIISVGFGLHRDVSLSLKRDNTFSYYKGVVYDEDMNPIPNVEVSVADKSVITDLSGAFDIVLPIEEQRIEQNVTLSKKGFKTLFIEDESPGINLKYVMHQ